jgi:uncharacterized protein GlcG (DUF336 family)
MMTMNRARLIVAAAIAKAKEIDQPMNRAVVDAGTNLWLSPAWTGHGLAASTAKAT